MGVLEHCQIPSAGVLTGGRQVMALRGWRRSVHREVLGMGVREEDSMPTGFPGFATSGVEEKDTHG